MHDTVIPTADVVALTTINGRQHVLLIERRWPPFADMLALPGGHVDPGEPPVHAAARELAEETGLTVAAHELVHIGTYDTPGRDPRGPYSTDAYLATFATATSPTAADDAATARWVPTDTLHALAFDHGDILGDAHTLPSQQAQ